MKPNRRLKEKASRINFKTTLLVAPYPCNYKNNNDSASVTIQYWLLNVFLSSITVNLIIL